MEKWFGGRASRTRKRLRPAIPAARKVRPLFELLEDRLAPSAVSWTGGAGTLNWTDAKNWSTGTVPTSADDVTINVAVSGPITASTLAAGSSSPESFTFTLPDGAAGAGNFQTTVTTGYGQSIKEYDSNGNPAYGNNTATTTFASTLASYADLTIPSGSLTVTSPAIPQSGNPVTIAWNDQNIGNAAVNAAFNDDVLVQKVNADNSLTTVASGFVSGNSTLTVGGGCPQSFTFTRRMAVPAPATSRSR
jgi:hypothetical protein